MNTKNICGQVPSIHLDHDGECKFIKQYTNLGEKSNSTVRFFDFSNCYAVFGNEDCTTVSKLIYKTNAYIRYFLDNEISLEYLTITKHHFENVARELLLLRNCCIEVYTRDVDTKGLEWRIKYRGSPGNLLQFEDILFSTRDQLQTATLLSVQLRSKEINAQKLVGIAVIDPNHCLFQICEFIDDDFYSELEAIIIMIGPKECVIPDVQGDYGIIKRILDRNHIMVTSTKEMVKAKNLVMQDLKNLLHLTEIQKEKLNTNPHFQYKLALEALRLAIKYLDLINNEGNLGQYELQTLNMKRFVHLDSAAMSALNIQPHPNYGFNHVNRKQSILDVLDQCRTPQGHRLISQWIKQPLRNRAILINRLDIVESFTKNLNVLQSLHGNYLKRIPDILLLTKRLQHKKISLHDLFRLYQVLLRIPNIIDSLELLQNPTVDSLICDSLKSCLQNLTGFKSLIEEILDFSAIDSREYLIKAEFHPDLNEMKQKMEMIHAKMENLQADVCAELKLDRGSLVRLETVAHLGYHFRMTLKDNFDLHKKKHFKILDVVKSGVRFSTDKLKELSDAFIDIKKQYEDHQSTIIHEIINVAMSYIAPFMSLNYEIAKLDCLVSFAVAAISAPTPYVRPKILDEGSGELKLRKVRHPCLEFEDNISYIANDVEFNKDYCNMYIITGPNMGGKSTFIRSVGTAVLMAHIGSFVACNEAIISMVDCILCRLGASDNLTKGLSTFMIEMVESSAIVRTATSKSLVIIDELGRGTCTYEGCGIAWAIAEYLAKMSKSFTLFATHFHEITDLSKSEKTVSNLYMDATVDNEKLILLYKVRPGIIERSFGIQIATMSGFPESVVQRAKNIYKDLDSSEVEEAYNSTKDNINDTIDGIITMDSTEMNEKDIIQLFRSYT